MQNLVTVFQCSCIQIFASTRTIKTNKQKAFCDISRRKCLLWNTVNSNTLSGRDELNMVLDIREEIVYKELFMECTSLCEN